MPCLKKCKCGKEEKFFKFLNEDEIEAFECEACPKEESAKTSEEKQEVKPEVVEKIEESPKEESAKSEDKKSRKKRQKVEEQKPE